MRRRGFTIIELLIVIAVIGILTALLLAAVQQSREAARRTKCWNNLRQHGLAMIAFEGQQRQFPAGMSISITGPLSQSEWRAWNYMADILPHLGVAANSARFDRSIVFHEGHNRAVVGQAFSIGICPSAPTREQVYTSSFVPSLVIPGVLREHPFMAPIVSDLDGRYAAEYLAGITDYTVVAGIDGGLAARHGYELADDAFYLPAMFPLPVSNLPEFLQQIGPAITSANTVLLGEGLRTAQIKDGLSNTVMMVEIAGRPQHWVRSERDLANEPIDRPWCDLRTVQFLEADEVLQSDNEKGLYSFHPKMVNVVYADGHVDGFSVSTESKIIFAAMTPDRGE